MTKTIFLEQVRSIAEQGDVPGIGVHLPYLYVLPDEDDVSIFSLENVKPEHLRENSIGRLRRREAFFRVASACSGILTAASLALAVVGASVTGESAQNAILASSGKIDDGMIHEIQKDCTRQIRNKNRNLKIHFDPDTKATQSEIQSCVNNTNFPDKYHLDAVRGGASTALFASLGFLGFRFSRAAWRGAAQFGDMSKAAIFCEAKAKESLDARNSRHPS